MTAASCNPMFTAVPSSGTGLAQNELDSVAAITPADIWAVGFANMGTQAAVDRTLAEHWNGTAWVTVGTPNVGDGNNNLAGVAGNDANDVWAVGNSQTGGVYQNLALHWNGSTWAAVSTPQPSPGASTFQALGGVAALSRGNVWAVGAFRNAAGTKQTLAIHWDGSTWAVVVTPNVGAGHNVLETVYARAPGDIWAVGYYYALAGATTNPQLTLIEHWDGTAWSVPTSPNAGPAGADNILFGVSASSPTEVWAVGSTVNASLAQTLAMHLVSGTWTLAASPNAGPGNNIVTSVVTLSPTNAWAGGWSMANPTAAAAALVEHWDGTAWTVQTADNPNLSGNFVNALAALPGNLVWAVGGGYPSPTTAATLAEQFQLPAPTAVTATIPTPTPQNAATVTWSAPACDGGFAITGYQVTAGDGCTVQGTWAAASSPATITGLTAGTPLSFVVQAVSASLGAETPSSPSAVVTPAGNSNYSSACSSKQYSLPSPDPATFADMDPALALSFTASADVMATITGNADLWTANSGLNQDLGILISGGTYGAGQVVAWKESGGSAGTFSPNAAAVQTVVPLATGTAYTVKLQWKGNRSFPGASIFAGAGPIGGDNRWSGSKGFSPTRLSVRQTPTSQNQVYGVATNKQYQLAGSDGQTWVDIDATGLTKTFTLSADSVALITANADLWTANSGYNQDIAIKVDSTVVSAWKESGGSAGTFSPNAAFVQAVVPLLAGSHTVKLQWKTNGPEGGATVFAGAGPWPAASTPAKFSPTQLAIWLMPSANITPATSSLQGSLTNSDAAGWTAMDTTKLQLSFTNASTTKTFLLSGTVDLWTAVSGYNQDVGIIVSGGLYGAGQVVAWKESGGLAGVFSPNAAYVETMLSLAPGTYTIWLAWKTNNLNSGSQIFYGAGPWPSGSATFSPTKLTAATVN